jgi:hypothetical protein
MHAFNIDPIRQSKVVVSQPLLGATRHLRTQLFIIKVGERGDGMKLGVIIQKAPSVAV